jgi:hypothetical protein
MPISTRVPRTILAAAALLAGVPSASAQTLGTFRWQQQPYCNVFTLNVVQSGGIYQLDGYDDQCGAPAPRASVVGIAFLNPSGTVGIGLTLVTTPGGTPVHLDATVNLASISGEWRDSAGGTGPFVFTPGAGAPGSPRPAPRTVFPAGLSAGGTTVSDVATPVAATDAASKGYVDSVTTGLSPVRGTRVVLSDSFSFSASSFSLTESITPTIPAGKVLLLQRASLHTLLTDSQSVMEARLSIAGAALAYIEQEFQAAGTTQRHFNGKADLDVVLSPGESLSLFVFRNNNLGSGSLNFSKISLTGFLVDAVP